MKISVIIKPNSRTESIERREDGSLIVKVRPAAKEGKANIALVKAISQYLDVPKSRISIAAGHASRKKIIHIS